METLEDPDGAYFLALPKGTRLFEYEIESVLGQGGFGITYLANDTLLDEPVAIKEYFPNESAFRTGDLSARAKSPQDRETFQSGLDAFLSEARIIARFRHRNIMQVRRFFEAHGTAYIVLQFESGSSFEAIVADAPLPEKQVLSIFAGILDGLEAVHERAILHRDIKPRNVIIRPDGAPVLIDFGAARDFSARDSQTVTKMASPGYSPPEQYGVGSQQGPWSDFYALGAMMYRAVTGKVPVDSLRRLRNDPLVPAMQIAAGRYSKPLLRVIDHMIRVDERERPVTVADIRAVLQPLSPAFAARLPEKQPSETKRPSAVTQKVGPAPEHLRADTTPDRGIKPKFLWLGLGALAVLAVAGGTAMVLRAPTSETAALRPEPESEKLVLSDKSKRPADTAPKAEDPRRPDATQPVQTAGMTPPNIKIDRQSDAKTVTGFEPGRVFRDCSSCPELVVVPAGRFEMGSKDGFPNEAPAHPAIIPAPFAIGTRPVTFAEWDDCVAAGGCSYKPNDQGWGHEAHPVVNVNWADVQSYLSWLSKTTGHPYRLPTETEWEYAARAGTTGAYPWGEEPDEGHANCADCVTPRPVSTQPTGSYAPNALGLYDTAGNAAEWVADCWRASYAVEPVKADDCSQRVVRGGSFRSDLRHIRSASRQRQSAAARLPTDGFRVVRDGP